VEVVVEMVVVQMVDLVSPVTLSVQTVAMAMAVPVVAQVAQPPTVPTVLQTQVVEVEVEPTTWMVVEVQMATT
jgi:hypothetical protein